MKPVLVIKYACRKITLLFSLPSYTRSPDRQACISKWRTHSRIISLEKLDHLLLPDMSYNAYKFKKCATVSPPAKPHISRALTLLKSSKLMSKIHKKKKRVKRGNQMVAWGLMYKICTIAKHSGTSLALLQHTNSIL